MVAIKPRIPMHKDYQVAAAVPINVRQIDTWAPTLFLLKNFVGKIIEYKTYPSRYAEMGRNNAIKEFLESPDYQKHTHLFFLDSDTWPDNPYAIQKLLSHQKPFVAGITPIMKQERDGQWLDYWSAIPLPNEPGQQPRPIRLSDELPKGLFRAALTGGTTMLIRRDVLEKLKPPYQKCIFNDDITDYVQSEDYYFTEQIRKAGFDLFVDPTVICHHMHYFDLLDFYNYIQRYKKVS